MIELVGRFIRWFVRFIGGPTLLRLVLLGLTMVSVERGLIAVVGHLQPDWLTETVLFAILVGWLLGRSRMRGWSSVLLVGALGPVWLMLSVGQLSPPLDAVLQTLPAVLKQALFRAPIDIGPLQGTWAAFIQTLTGLTDRLSLWSRYFGTSLLIVDPGVTSLVWGLVLWLVSGWAAWWLRRRESIVVGLLPATTILVYNVYYTNSKNGILWLVFVGGGWILLQALNSYFKARRRWQEHHMGQTEIEVLLAGSTILIATGLMLAGGLLPSVSIQKLSDNLQRIFQGQQNRNLAELLGLQQTPAMIGHTGASGIGISDTHAIGPGPQLSQQVMMYVSVDGYIPPPPNVVMQHANPAEPEVRFYWRSQTYDSYNGHVWIANGSSTQEFPANSPYHPNLTSLSENFQQVRQHVERLQEMDGALFVSGDLISVDQPSVAAWRPSGDLIDARTNADKYTADSAIQDVTVKQLEQSGDNYPDSVRNYLTLPDELPARVRDLAVSLTINQPTPYEKVMAIQNYLRQFPYSLDVPGAPVGRDVADFFLFDLQKGYCDYFATTMAVLVRVAGIPARMVTGFSMGSYDYTASHFVVVEANAHSWVEVYFPGLGWVEFEPTTNLPAIHRPGEFGSQTGPSAAIPTPMPAANNGGTPINWASLRKPLRVAEFVLAGLALLLILWRFLPVESWWLSLRPVEQSLPAIQRQLYHQGRSWGVTTGADYTPHEFAKAFSLIMTRYERNPRMLPFVADLREDVQRLTDLYTRLLFSQHPPTPEEHKQAVRNWARVRKSLRKIRNS